MAIRRIIGSLSAAGLLLMGMTAQAAILNISGGTGIVTPSNNNVLGSGWSLRDNAEITTTVGNVLIKFYYLGAESGYTNTLRSGSNSHPENNAPQPGQWPGTFLFSRTFATPVPASPATLAGEILYFTSSGFSGSLRPGSGSLARSIAFAYLDPTKCTLSGNLTLGGDKNCVSATEVAGDTNMLRYVLFSLDDSGAGPDDNHDDYVGYFSYQVVPLPAAFWLLGSGLIGLVGLSRRRSLKA